jgi:hypothetical protein
MKKTTISTTPTKPSVRPGSATRIC